MALSRRKKTMPSSPRKNSSGETSHIQAKGTIKRGLVSLVVLATVFYLHLTLLPGVHFFDFFGLGEDDTETLEEFKKTTRIPPSTRCPVDHCLALGKTPKEQYPNLVRLDGGGKSGLFDRIGIINHFANIAAMFCARLQLPPPHIMLARFHNRGQRIDKNLTWQDFASYEFLTPNHTLKGVNDGKLFPRVVWDVLLPDDETTTATLDGSSVGTVHLFNHTADTSGENDYYKMWKIVQKQKEQLGSASRESFVLNMAPQHSWRWIRDIVERTQVKGMMTKDDITDKDVIPSFQVNRHSPCGKYVHYQFPKVVMRLAELVMQEAARRSTQSDKHSDLLWFGFLHLRRGDIAKNCDTSLDKMRSYFQCSFAGPQAVKFFNQRVEHQKHLSQSARDAGETPFVIFLATDETDRKYRKDMLKMIERQHEQEVTVDSDKTTRRFKAIRSMDLDRLIMDILKQEVEAGTVPLRLQNNQVVFLVGRVIAQLATFTLEQRKDLDCDGCNIDKVEPALAKYNSLMSSNGDYDYKRIHEMQRDKWNHVVFYDKTQLLNNSTNHQMH